METVELGTLSLCLILNPSIDIGVADGVGNIMAEIAGEIGSGLLLLLPGRDFGKLFQIIPEEQVYMAFMHVGTHVPVVTVS